MPLDTLYGLLDWVIGIGLMVAFALVLTFCT